MKRFFDCCGSALALAALAPVLLVLAVFIRVSLGAPVVFKQTRAGLGGRWFTIHKYRSMIDARDAHGELLPDSERLRGFGRFLRTTSLDELPELWNVLRGDMSFVGPRPLPVAYLERYSEEQARRHEVRPGITGWAQVNGRNTTNWPERLRMDVWYVDHRCLKLDCKILLLTVWKVLRREGISAKGHETMPPFRGER